MANKDTHSHLDTDVLAGLSHFGFYHFPLTEDGLYRLKKSRLFLVMAMTVTMMVVEFVAGILTNSLALVSDAAHMLTHFFALTVSYLAIIFAARQTSKERSFGSYRAESLAALVNGLTLILITFFIAYRAYLKIVHPQPILEVQMMIVAVIGLIVNLISAAILWKIKAADLNVKSAYLHLLTDTFSSVAIIAGAIVIHYTGWNVIDPILSVVICIIILIWAKSLLRDSFNVLMEAAPKHIRVDEVIRALKQDVPGVEDVHDVHIWEIATKMYAMTVHIVVKDNKRISDCSGIKSEIKRLMRERYHILHTNIEFECPGFESR
jgi:cobalt-zinc-cadmium efflux system protein